DMEAVLGLAELREELKRLPERAQVLHIDLSGRDPDEGMNQVPYEKGALLLRTIEQAVGRERFDRFLREYFDAHAFQSITTSDFEVFLKEKLLGRGPAPSRPIDLTAWIEQPGLPAGFAEPASERLALIDRAAAGWIDGSIATEKLGGAGWSTLEWL